MSGETLVVVSKIKAHIKKQSGMNTSASFVDAISEKVEALCAKAIEHAEKDKRKTVLDRDLSALEQDQL